MHNISEVKKIGDEFYKFSGSCTLYGGSYNEDYVEKTLREKVKDLNIKDEVILQQVYYTALYLEMAHRMENIEIEKVKSGSNLQTVRRILDREFIFTVNLTNYTGEYDLKEIAKEYANVALPEDITEAEKQAIETTMIQLDTAERLVTTKVEIR